MVGSGRTLVVFAAVCGLCFAGGWAGAEEKPVRTDSYGDPLPPNALARLGTVRLHHHDLILSLALSPDGKTVASAGGWDGSPRQPIRLWDLATGKEIRQFVGHTGFVGCVAFSPDGRLLASVATMGDEASTSSDFTVRLWDVATGKQLRVLCNHLDWEHNATESRYGAAFSPDGKTLAAAGQDGFVRLWDVSTGKQLRRWQVESPRVAFSPDGKTLAMAGQAVFVVNVDSDDILKVLDKLPVPIESVQFSPDGRVIVASGGDKTETVQGWDWKESKQCWQVKGGLLGSTPDGKRIAVRGKTDVILWDVGQGKEIRRFPAKDRFASHSLVVSYTGALTAGGGTLAAADWSTIRVVNTEDGKDLFASPGHRQDIVFVGFSPDGRQVVSAGDSTVRIWDASTARQLFQIQADRKPVCSAAMSLDGRLLAYGNVDGAIRLWDIPARREIRRIAVEPGTSPLVAVSPDGKSLAAKVLLGGHERTLFLWNAATGQQLWAAEAGNGGQAFTFSPDGKNLLVRDPYLYAYSTKDGKRLAYFEPIACRAGPALTPDGRIAATGYGDFDAKRSHYLPAVSLWEMASGTMIAQFQGHGDRISALAFSADGKLLATGSWDGEVRLWDPSTGSQLARYSGHRGGIESLAFSPSGKQLASGGSDATVLIWDVADVKAVNPTPPAPLAPKDLDRLWVQLLSRDASTAYPAIGKLVAAPEETVRFLEQELQTVGGCERDIRRRIAELDDDRFDVREIATQDLQELGIVAMPALRQALQSGPSPEAQWRMEKILAGRKDSEKCQSGHMLRWLRAVQALEYINTKKSRRLLAELVRQEPDTQRGQEAKAALQRLSSCDQDPTP